MTARLAMIGWLLALVLAGAQGPSRVFVVVFDDQQLSSRGLKRLQTAASSLFSSELRPGDLGGVVVDGRLVNDRLLSIRDDLMGALLF